jgi:hypothetical protein
MIASAIIEEEKSAACLHLYLTRSSQAAHDGCAVLDRGRFNLRVRLTQRHRHVVRADG